MISITLQGLVKDPNGIPIPELPTQCFQLEKIDKCKPKGSANTDVTGRFIITVRLKKNREIRFLLITIGDNPPGHNPQRTISIASKQVLIDLGTFIFTKTLVKQAIPSPSPRLKKLAKTSEISKSEKTIDPPSPVQVETPPRTRKSNLQRTRSLKIISKKGFLSALFNGIFLTPPKEIVNETLLFEFSRTKEITAHSKSLPQVRLKLKKDTKSFSIQSLEIRRPDEEEWNLTTPSDRNFNRSLVLAKNTILLKHELEGRFALCCLLPSLIAMAFAGSIKENPIKSLLEPFIPVDTIKNGVLCEGFMSDHTGILSALGISQAEISLSAKNTLSRIEFTDFTPREPYCETDYYNLQAEIYWNNVIVPTVIDFFEFHRLLIIKHWNEIYGLSQKLEEAEVPIEAITLNPDKPQESEMNRLKQFCNVVLFLTTFEFSIRVLHHDKTVGEDGFLSLHLQANAVNEAKRLRDDPIQKQNVDFLVAQLEKRTSKSYVPLLEHPSVNPTMKKYLSNCTRMFASIKLNVNDIVTLSEK
jgi:hypothetical protein